MSTPHKKARFHAGKKVKIIADAHIIKAKKKAVLMKSGRARKERVTDAKVRVPREKTNANVPSPDEVKRALNDLAANDAAVNYLKKKVSKRAVDVLNLLVTPKTDEALALELDLKINAVRRILNLLQGSGITNYYVAKNVNGWLSFAWYVNSSKFVPFFDYVAAMENKRSSVNEECNDYFVCNKCYDRNKLIFTFDAAFEEGFKCGTCDTDLKMINKEDALKLTKAAETQMANSV